jgi:hypothetical protein
MRRRQALGKIDLGLLSVVGLVSSVFLWPSQAVLADSNRLALATGAAVFSFYGVVFLLDLGSRLRGASAVAWNLVAAAYVLAILVACAYFAYWVPEWWRKPLFLLPFLFLLLTVLMNLPERPPHEIHVAAKEGAFDRVRSLIAANPSLVSLKDASEWTALHWSVAEGHEALAELLIAHKADIEAKGRRGPTPLIVAAARGRHELVEFLLRNGADIDGHSAHTRETALHRAVRENHRAVVELLIAHKANVNLRDRYDVTPLAAAAGKAELSKILADHGAKD